MARLLYFLVEGSVREALGPTFILGNHVVVRLDDGTHTALAHLQQHSVRVSHGDRVKAGDWIAACGNSGNSTEPHLHFQLMDISRPAFAVGLPFSFHRYRTNGHVKSGVPVNSLSFTVAAGREELSVDLNRGYSTWRTGMSEELVGVVDHWYGDIKVAGVTVTDGHLNVGDKIHIIGHTTDLSTTVGSMQIEHSEVQDADTGDQVGIKVADRVRVGDEVYLVSAD